MPQFVPNGPVVPDRLVQDLEDDRVVIFCGAGISMGAGLPSYAGLVKHCYRELTHPLPDDHHSDWIWPDRMLGALESRFSAERVRQIVAECLSKRPRDLAFHRAILRLAQLRTHDGLRLVTTNFDTYFERASRRSGLRYQWHAGPVVPIPRNDQMASWRSLVYLHGRLSQGRMQQLVLTSADFGRAYLTDAWAARFVARLFSDFSVLFIGYSLNDPVLRYMTDAFAAEDSEIRFGQPRGPAYIFTSFDGETAPDAQPFLDRNLEPIFYRSSESHLLLKETILAWATARDDYLANVNQLISDIAPRRPDAINPTDTANLLWAVSGRPGDNGHGARIFAAVDDLPAIEWLDALEARDAKLLEEHRLSQENAVRHGRPPPLPPQLDISPLFPPALDERELGLTPVGYGLIPWLGRHLGTEGFVDRVIAKLERGRSLHVQLRAEIRRRLAGAHNLPDGYVRFWRIVAAEGKWLAYGSSPAIGPAWVVRESVDHGLCEGWLRQELLAALRPFLKLSLSSFRHFRQAMGPAAGAEPIGRTLSEIADSEVVLTEGDHVRLMIEAINERPDANHIWSDQLDDLTSLLAQALHLFDAAGQASSTDDPSAFQRPSIAPHRQNHNYREWTLLFDLIWQGWTHLDGIDSTRSRAMVQRWRSIPYLAFRRLALAAMNFSPHFSAEDRMEVLLHG